MSRGLVLPAGGAAAAGHRVVLGLLLVGTAAGVLAVRALDAPLVLTLLVALGVGLPAVLVKPELATVAFAFLLYSNLPVVLHRSHGVPQIISGSFLLLLAFPLLRHLLYQRQRPRFDRLFGLMLALLGVMLVSSLLRARDAAVAGDAILGYAIEGLVLYWLVVNSIRTAGSLRAVLWTLLAAGVLLSSLNLYQAATGSYHMHFGGLAERTVSFDFRNDPTAALSGDPSVFSNRADGPQLGHNRFAQVMMVILPASLLLFRLERRRLARGAALLAGVTILVGGIALTYSRGAVVTLAVLVGLALWLRWLPTRRTLAALALAALLVPVISPTLYERITSLRAVSSLDDPAEADGALRGRATEMLAAVFVFRDHPILGVGPGQYAPFYSVEYHQIPEIKFRDINHQRRAHTLYFELGAELGVIGLAVFLAIPALLLRELWQLRRNLRGRRPELEQLATSFILSLAAYLVSALFLSLAFQRYYWFLIALSSAAVYLIHEHAGPAAVASPQVAERAGTPDAKQPAVVGSGGE
jgi:putative inorganic carbon (HCO3(-)) transporter